MKLYPATRLAFIALFSVSGFGTTQLRAQSDDDTQAVNDTVSSLTQTEEGLSDDECVCDNCQEKLAAGKWTGAFWVAYDVNVPGAPMKFHQKYQGNLDLLVKKSGEHYDNSSLVADEDHIRGKASAQMAMTMSGSTMGANLSGGANSQGELDMEADGPPIGPGDFAYIYLKREPGGFNMDVTADASTADAVVNGKANLNANGAGTLDLKGHTRDSSFAKNTNVSGAADTSTGEKKKVTWFQLNLDAKSCSAMSGKVDTTALVQSMAANGMGVTVTDSNWAATYDDRDPNFEQQVEQLISEPTPSHPTTADVQELVNRAVELRGNGDPYHLCVIAPLFAKMIRMDLMLMRHEAAFVNWLPVDSVDQVSNGLQQIMLCQRFLQLLGADNCKIAKDLKDQVEKKFRQAVKAMIERHHTPAEMLGVEREVELGMVSLGEVQQEFYQTWKADGLPGNPG
ncbi:MAG TPA: hypothetical protein VIM69_07035 [Opitutaceae bacterium]